MKFFTSMHHLAQDDCHEREYYNFFNRKAYCMGPIAVSSRTGETTGKEVRIMVVTFNGAD